MKKLVSLLFISLMVFSSCEDDLNINTNPNTPPEIDKGLALSAAQASITTILGGEWFVLGGMYAQFYTQAPSASQYDAIEEYNLNTDFANRTWTELYSGALNDLQFVQDEAIEDGDTGTYLIAMVLKAYTLQYLVDLFGDVPYTEALLGNDNISPAVTSGEEIYMDLIATIDEALANFEEDPVNSNVGAQDLIYNADMNNWIEFANTLKLKLYLRMAYTSRANSAAVMNLINEGNFLSEDAAFTAFADATGKRNPYYEVQIEFLGNVNTVASNSLFQFFLRNDDPRLDEVFIANDAGLQAAIDQGEGLSFGGIQARNLSRPNIDPETPVYFMTVAESNFLQAEALVRYAGGAGAEALYNQGVAESFALHGLTGAAEFTGSGGAYEYVATGDVETDIEQIIVQKWASLVNLNNIEAWIETLRTGYPLLTNEEDPDYEEGRRIVSLASVLPGDQVIQSLFYPDLEVQRNTNLTQKPNVLQKVWWNQR